MKIFIHRFFFV